MPRKFKTSHENAGESVEFLRSKILEAAAKDEFIREEMDELGPEDCPLESAMYGFGSLTDRVERDLSKVEFDLENVSMGTGGDSDYGFPGLIGFNTLESGLTFLGCGAGGDWETPLFFLIYWDGRQLRGYVPKDGNPWNTDKMSAYGNNCDRDPSDVKNARERFGESASCSERKWREYTSWMVEGVAPDVGKIRADILARIQKAE
jgi:hypothetical protein